MKKSKDNPSGKTNIESVSGGKRVPRKAGLKDQTAGKSIGTRKIGGFGGSGPFNFVGRK